MLKKRITLCLCLFSITAALSVFAVNVSAQVPAEAEARLRAIYEGREFSVRSFRATWLEDGSGYTVMETVPGSNERVRVRYDAASGKRTVLDQPQREETRSRSGNTSPDGQLAVYSEKGNLHLRDLNSGNTIQLTKNAVEGSISNGRAIWSPDSKWIAFIQTDRSGVPFRSSLIRRSGKIVFPGWVELFPHRVSELSMPGERRFAGFPFLNLWKVSISSRLVGQGILTSY